LRKTAKVSGVSSRRLSFPTDGKWKSVFANAGLSVTIGEHLSLVIPVRKLVIKRRNSRHRPENKNGRALSSIASSSKFSPLDVYGYIFPLRD
jgi:hypothetical protein